MTRSDIAVFLDRDGTVNVEENYISSPDQLQLIPRTGTAIRELNNLGTRVFIITNQSGVARGYFSEAAVHDIHEALRALLKKENAFVDDFFYCPHLRGQKLNAITSCAIAENRNRECSFRHSRNTRSIFAVHSSSETGASISRRGKAVGASTVMVSTGYGAQEILNCRNQPNFFAHDLLDACSTSNNNRIPGTLIYSVPHSMKVYPKPLAVILFLLVSLSGCSQSPTSVGSKLIPGATKYAVRDTTITSIGDTTFKFSPVNGGGSSLLVGNSSSVDVKSLLLFFRDVSRFHGDGADRYRRVNAERRLWMERGISADTGAI